MVGIKSRRVSPFERLRFQLGGCLLLGSLLPYLTRLAIGSSPSELHLLNITLLATMVATTCAVMLARGIAVYPGVEATAYVLPAFFLSYGVLLLVLVLGRLEYNRATLLAGFLLSWGWYYVLAQFAQRRQLRIGYVAEQTERPDVLGRVHWVRLADVAAPVDDLDAVVVDLRWDTSDDWERRLTDIALTGKPVFHSKHLLESLTGRVELEHLSENSFGSLSPVSSWMMTKHAIDWVAALVLGVVLLVPMLVVAFLVRVSSPGPALFVQTRIGFQGRAFRVFKFRTMRVSTEEQDARHSAITQAGDARITPLGRFLRTSRLDELPQIINVLKGEMSWIGPRPEAEVLSRWYEQEIPFYRYRHIVRPGIAGWAQVCQGHVAEVAEVTSKLHYDFYYIKNYSPWMDLLIVARTIKTMITGFGSR